MLEELAHMRPALGQQRRPQWQRPRLRRVGSALLLEISSIRLLLLLLLLLLRVVKAGLADSSPNECGDYVQNQTNQGLTCI